MLENSRALNSRVFIGVLSQFPKLKTSIFRIAGQPFIRWIRVIRSLSNLRLNCNHCIYMLYAGREVRIGKNCAQDRGHSFALYGPT